jgi:hypothetical protein
LYVLFASRSDAGRKIMLTPIVIAKDTSIAPAWSLRGGVCSVGSVLRRCKAGANKK